MNTLNDSQERARRFNEDEAIWRRYDEKCFHRLLLGRKWWLLREEVLKQLDWAEAEREVRPTRCIGFAVL